MRGFVKVLAIGAIAAVVQMSAPVATTAVAQGYSNMTCGQLWYARNRIYADAGFCFKTARARRTFGAGYFPPYGRLSGWAREEVNRIQAWEARNGC